MVTIRVTTTVADVRPLTTVRGAVLLRRLVSRWDFIGAPRTRANGVNILTSAGNLAYEDDEDYERINFHRRRSRVV